MTTTATATLGHIAIHYRPGDFDRARVLFDSLGAHLEDNGPNGFCTIVFDRGDWNYVDNVMYLSQAGPVKLGLEAAITESLRLGEADEDPRATAFRELRSASPSPSTTSASATRRSTSWSVRCSRSKRPPGPAARSKAEPSSASTGRARVRPTT